MSEQDKANKDLIKYGQSFMVGGKHVPLDEVILSQSEQDEKIAAFKADMQEKGMYIDLYNESLIEEAWQAATAEANKRIDALESEIAELKSKVSYLESGMAEIYETQILELQAHINRLREALEAIVNSARDKNCGLRIADEALASTPAQSLADFEDEVLERCAKVCDTSDKSTHPSELADAIREMKVE